MTILVIDIIATLAKAAMIFGVIGLSLWAAYIIYTKHEQSKAMGSEEGVIEKITKGIISFAYFVATKLKEK